MVRSRASALFMVAALILLGADAAVSRARVADMPDKAAQTNVDVELVLAVDVSFSMDPDEQALQREGYREALISPEFLNALRQGMHGRIACHLCRMGRGERSESRLALAGHRRPRDGAGDCRRDRAAADAPSLSHLDFRRALFAATLFEESAYRGIRRVIDVSGDGTNNQGHLVTVARDEVLAKGITINGLPIMLKRPAPGSIDIEDLDIYYEDCVIGGPAAFVIPIRAREKFKDAVRTKLVLEVAGLTPQPWIVPAAADAPRISCTIGERMWQQRWGRGGYDFN